ncbi:hypothetical protein H632_c589p2 [Helicosporidium sp. ATCC 50920]|nr:hypothetical protein H632_c589p2 [Helicosporidium sp. ATCC 50920]|eukprot:KDD75619.1 hypothetical protein H632_c589p2 [Helicosporidium sp. ATCC 50920]
MSQLFKTYGKDGHKTSAQTQLKSSVQRSIRNKIAEQYPWLESNGVLEVLLPKRADLTLIKLPEHVQLLVHDKHVMFFSTRDGGWFPTLRIVHQYPQCIPRLRADRGAIKFMLSGANMMCPGLTSPGATIHDEVEKGTPVALYGEDCEPALAIGYTTLSTQQIREQNKGIGVENLHYLTDGLWKNPKID